MRIVGIKPGSLGGIVIMNENGVIETVQALVSIEKEVDVIWFESFLREKKIIGIKDHYVFVERGEALSGNGAPNIHIHGENCGNIKSTLKLLRIPFELVSNSTWTRVFHSNTTAKLSKDKSKEAVVRFYKTEQLLDPSKPNSYRMHEGIVEATLIARFGLMKLLKDPKFSHLVESKIAV